ncbi:hypothetical protein EJ110_NYTH41800 [Nymphaea thermarum]|nr:hypothetical protein EJ110_NYTH41800 [Nymphaea thermarum]
MWVGSDLDPTILGSACRLRSTSEAFIVFKGKPSFKGIISHVAVVGSIVPAHAGSQHFKSHISQNFRIRKAYPFSMERGVVQSYGAQSSDANRKKFHGLHDPSGCCHAPFLSATAATLDGEGDKGEEELRRNALPPAPNLPLRPNMLCPLLPFPSVGSVFSDPHIRTHPSVGSVFSDPHIRIRTHRLVIFRSPSPRTSPASHCSTANPMVSILSSTLPTSSRFPPLVQFRPAAAKRPPVVAKARPGDGPTMMSMRPAMAMHPDAKRPWWSPVFGIGRSGRADSKDPTPDRGDDGEGRSNRSGLTAEKARLLRRKFRAMDSWHDAMYHSAIASRLACADHP